MLHITNKTTSAHVLLTLSLSGVSLAEQQRWRLSLTAAADQLINNETMGGVYIEFLNYDWYHYYYCYDYSWYYYYYDYR